MADWLLEGKEDGRRVKRVGLRKKVGVDPLTRGVYGSNSCGDGEEALTVRDTDGEGGKRGRDKDGGVGDEREMKGWDGTMYTRTLVAVRTHAHTHAVRCEREAVEKLGQVAARTTQDGLHAHTQPDSHTVPTQSVWPSHAIVLARRASERASEH